MTLLRRELLSALDDHDEIPSPCSLQSGVCLAPIARARLPLELLRFEMRAASINKSLGRSKLMSGEKRHFDPSISAANPKRQFSEEHEKPKCSICLDLVVDAVQVICCGTLYCRSCICNRATCTGSYNYFAALKFRCSP